MHQCQRGHCSPPGWGVTPFVFNKADHQVQVLCLLTVECADKSFRSLVVLRACCMCRHSPFTSGVLGSLQMVGEKNLVEST